MAEKTEILESVPAEHQERFWRAVHRANREFRELPDRQRGVFGRFKAIRAGCFWALMVDAAQAEFAGTEVVVKEKSGTLTFSFRGHVVVQLKKVDKKGNARWGKTKRARAFNLGVRLPGEPEMHSAYVGYMMDTDGIRLERIVMAQGEGQLVPAWIHDIAEPDQLPLTGIPAEERRASRVRPAAQVEAQTFRKIDGEKRGKDATESA